MASIGTLALKITANAGGLTSGLAAARNAVSGLAGKATTGLKGAAGAVLNFKGSVLGLATSLPVLGGAIGGLLGGAGLTAWIKSNMDGVVATGRLSDRLGITTEAVIAMHKAAKGAGMDTEVFDAGLGKLAKELSMAAQGSTEVQGKFARLGLDAFALAQMPIDQAFRRIADRAKELGPGVGSASVAFAAFGKAGQQMVPILNQGSQAIDDAAKSAQKNGEMFSKGDYMNTLAAQQSLKKLENSMRGVGVQLAVQLAPFIKAGADSLMEWGVSGQGAAGKVADALEWVATGFGYLGDFIQTWKVGWTGLKVAAELAIGGIAKAIAWLLNLAAKLPSALGGDKFKGWADSVNEVADNWLWAAEREAKAGLEMTKQPWAHEQVKGWFDSVRGGARAAADEVNRMQGAIDHAGNAQNLAAMAHQFELFEKGAKVMEEMMSPLDKYKASILELNELWQAGAISYEVYLKGIAKANDEIMKNSSKAIEIKHAGALQYGTKEAYSAILKSQGQTQDRDPVRQLVQSLKEQRDLERRQLEETKKLVELTQNPRFAIAEL